MDFKVLAVGDVVGNPGLERVRRSLRYLKRQTGSQPVLEETAAHLARGVARAAGQREPVLHTLVCLDVMHERGLITLHSRADRLQVALNNVEGKVDLEASSILLRLREQLAQ